MKKCISFGGRLLALLFILSTIFGTSAVYAKSNAWDEWQAVVTQDNVNNDDLLMSVKNTFAVELWHYSGGYWGNNLIRIYDRQVFDDPDELADAVMLGNTVQVLSCECKHRFFGGFHPSALLTNGFPFRIQKSTWSISRLFKHTGMFTPAVADPRILSCRDATGQLGDLGFGIHIDAINSLCTARSQRVGDLFADTSSS